MTTQPHPNLRPAPSAPPREPVAPAPAVRRRWPWLVAVVAALAVGWWWHGRSAAPGAAAPARSGPPPVPVVVATARTGELPVYLSGLGTVTAFNTVTVKSRVDGQIVRIAFEEGQHVKEGELLAEIDPRPFEVALTQAEGALARDDALLRDARLTTDRYRDLLKQGVVSKQEYDDQAAKVGQYEGATRADQGLIDNAKLQLVYSKVTAPIAGRVGLRRVDAGNVVHANDTTGLVVITQLQPIAVVFTTPEDNLPALMKRMGGGQPLPVEAFDRAGRTRLATGTLLTLDNQIDQTTGTMRLKAVFPNDDGALFPNQFVNVRLLLESRPDVVVVPVAAIQRGPQGTFAYVVKPDKTVEVRPVVVGPTSEGDAAIESGLAGGDVVVTDGVDKLRPGAAVQPRATEADATAPKPSG